MFRLLRASSGLTNKTVVWLSYSVKGKRTGCFKTSWFEWGFRFFTFCVNGCLSLTFPQSSSKAVFSFMYMCDLFNFFVCIKCIVYIFYFFLTCFTCLVIVWFIWLSLISWSWYIRVAAQQLFAYKPWWRPQCLKHVGFFFWSYYAWKNSSIQVLPCQHDEGFWHRRSFLTNVVTHF